MSRFRIIALFISLVPIGILRKVLYRLIMGYEIELSAKVGFGAVIVGQDVRIGHSVIVGNFVYIHAKEVVLSRDSRLYRFVIVSGLEKFELKDGAFIGVKCKIFTRYPSDVNVLGSTFTVGKNSHITNSHLFDLYRSIEVGDNVTIGGANSLFYTHGIDHNRKVKGDHIIIKDNVTFGAAVVVVPGVQISSGILVAAGSVVHKSLSEPGFYGGNPIVFIK